MKPISRSRRATSVVCKNWLPHVTQIIDDYLSGSLSHNALSAACKAGASKPTLDYILERTIPVRNEAVTAAVQGGHLHLLRWMTGRDDGRGPWQEDLECQLELAATLGHLDVVKWLFQYGMSRGMFWYRGKAMDGYVGGKTWLYQHSASEALRLAAEYGHLEVVQWVFAQNEACSGRCGAIGNAVAKGQLAIAQWLHSVRAEEHCSAEAVDEAAMNGHLEVLQWLDSNHLFTCTASAMQGAAGNGHSEVVKWLHRAHHSESCSSEALGRATNSGNLELVEWLYENVYGKCHHDTEPLSVSTVAEGGHLDVLKWMHAHFPGSFSSAAMDAAARNGHLHVLVWLHEHRGEGCSHFAPRWAAQNGHLGVLEWLHTHYPSEFRSSTMDAAVQKDHLDVVRWLNENRTEGCTTEAMYSAATAGHLDTFLYLLEHRTERFFLLETHLDFHVRCNFNVDIHGNRCANQVTSGQLAMLKTAVKERPNCVRESLRMLAEVAVIEGHLAILDWVGQFGIKFHSTAPICVAIRRGDTKMLRWFWENGFGSTDPDLLDLAVRCHHVKGVRWLSEHGYVLNSLQLVKTAVVYGSVSVLRWVVENGPTLDLATARSLVFDFGHIEMAWWVAEDVRQHLVFEALEIDNREILWWILVHTTFQDERVRRSIRDAIQRSPNDIQQWFQEHASKVPTCRWCFSVSGKRKNEASEEASLSSGKAGRCRD